MMHAFDWRCLCSADVALMMMLMRSRASCTRGAMLSRAPLDTRVCDQQTPFTSLLATLLANGL